MDLLARFLWLAVRMIQGPARWFSRRFTTAGAMLCAGLMVSLGTANPAQTLGLSAFLVLLVMLGMAMLWAPFFRPRLTLRRHAPRLAACGEPVSVTITLRNHTPRWQRGMLYGENLRAVPLVIGAVRDWLRQGRHVRTTSRPVPVPPLPPWSTASFPVMVTARRRGPLAIPGGLISRSDPLGLFRGFCVLSAPSMVLVLPARHRLPPLDLPGFRRPQPGGQALASRVGAAEDFAALRDYRRGDPRKHIHWRSTARTGDLVVKEFHDEELVRYALVLDPGDPGEVQAFEDAVAVAASFTCTIPDQEVLLDLLFVGDQALRLSSGRGLGPASPMLEALATITPKPAAFAALESLVLTHVQTLSALVLVVTAWDGPRRGLVRILRSKGVPVTVLLVSSGAVPSIEDPAERPDRLIQLIPGRLSEGLAELGRRP